MECADTDICLQRIVTLLERKDYNLQSCLVTLITLTTLFSLFIIFYFILKYRSVTSLFCRTWFVVEERLIEEGAVEVLAE